MKLCANFHACIIIFTIPSILLANIFNYLAYVYNHTAAIHIDMLCFLFL